MAFIHAKKCNAKSKRSGKECRNPAVTGSTKCRLHGGLSTGPKDPSKLKGNLNAMKYGAYVNRLISQEEKEVFEEFYGLLHRNFVLNESSDRMSSEVACLYFIRLLRAIESGNDDAIHKADSLLRKQLQDLKATKDRREGGDSGGLKGGTPAEWAAALLVKYGYTKKPSSSLPEPDKTEE